MNGDFWVSTLNGVINFNPTKDDPNRIEPNINIENIKLENSDFDYLKYAKSIHDSSKLPVNLKLPFTKNNVSFNFRGTSLSASGGILYSYMLEGYDKEFNQPTKATSATYTNLPGGQYTFRVKACNNNYVWNKEPASLTFQVIPPYYQTMWFYIVVIIAFFGIMFLIIWIRTHKIHHKNRLLELNVKQQAVELNSAYFEIQDSQKYAKRIQDAILYNIDKLKDILPESFVFFKPREFVSGDFFWLKRSNGKTYLAVADCTGHGVPGAFMSIIGHNILNQAINERKLDDPANILNFLNLELSHILSSTMSTADVREGIDIALCQIDFDKKEMLYAGAYNPVYIYGDEGLKELKAEKIPIGQYHEKTRSFENQVCKLNPNDMIYIVTDGFASQFGGKDNKKYKGNNLRSLLQEIKDLEADEQKIKVGREFLAWKGENEQVDDILVLGTRVPS